MKEKVSSVDSRLRRRSSSPKLGRGFSLIEMITVIAVIGLIVAMTAPMLFSTLKANRLTAAGEELINRISLAQQMAVSRNHEVEMRFYSYSDLEDPGSAPHYRATLIVKPVVDPAGTETEPVILGEISRLRNGIVVGDSIALSPILADSARSSQTDTDEIIQGTTASYKSIRFRPDGTCDLTSVPADSYITVVEERDVQSATGDIPKNFFAIQIDPYTSRCTTYRP